MSAITEAAAVIRKMADDLKHSCVVVGTDKFDPDDPGAEQEYRYLLDLAARLEREERPRMVGGYQPTGPSLDPSNPPRPPESE